MRTGAVLRTGVIGAVLALAVAGCGGSETTGKDAAAIFKERTTSICAQAHGDMLKVGDGFADPASPTKAELTGAVGKLVSVLSTEHDGLKGVQAPTAQAPAYGQLLTSLQGVIDSAKKKGSAFINPNTTPFAVVNANATALGLDACVH